MNKHMQAEQISLFDSAEENPILALHKVDVYNMTPMQAMNPLLEWKQYQNVKTHESKSGT